MKIENVHILLVESDKALAAQILSAFDKARVSNHIHVAANGANALEMLKGAQRISPAPRIALINQKLPDMNGLELIGQIRGNADRNALSMFLFADGYSGSEIKAAGHLNPAGCLHLPKSEAEWLETIEKLYAFWKICEFV